MNQGWIREDEISPAGREGERETERGERSHLPILRADAHMLSTFIQTDLVDLH